MLRRRDTLAECTDRPGATCADVRGGRSGAPGGVRTPGWRGVRADAGRRRDSEPVEGGVDPEPPVPGPSRGGTGSQVAVRPTLYGRPPVRAPREPGHRSVEAAGQWLAGAGVLHHSNTRLSAVRARARASDIAWRFDGSQSLECVHFLKSLGYRSGVGASRRVWGWVRVWVRLGCCRGDRFVDVAAVPSYCGEREQERERRPVGGGRNPAGRAGARAVRCGASPGCGRAPGARRARRCRTRVCRNR